ncbi:MAG: GDP-mannose 4,6-dehydratase [Oceanidesulfovibrio sp.]
MQHHARTALITGVTGQDGAYLAEFLLAKGYTVHGLRRRSSQSNVGRISHLLEETHAADRRFILHHGDLTDAATIACVLQRVRPDEVYNLGAQTHVKVSFEMPEHTANTDALGALRLLEAIRILGMVKHCRYYQASSSEMFGLAREALQSENTAFHPRSPYACAKLYAYWVTVNYREAYSMFAVNGILFNHESPRRGETFVTRKITRGLARIAMGLQERLCLGNLNARRDWGHARDYVEAMWRMLQADVPADYCVATGESRSVREFVEHAAAELGLTLRWEGHGLDERGVVDSFAPRVIDAGGAMAPIDPERLRPGRVLVSVDPEYFRPSEVDGLRGDSARIREQLGWRPRTSFAELVREMVTSDLRKAARDANMEIAEHRAPGCAR